MRIELKDKLAALGCGIMLSALCLACTDSLDIVDSGTELDDVPTSYISLSIKSPSKYNLTRTDPKGGEYGDGSEKGQDYENEITSVALFLYQDENGINGSGADDVTLVTFDNADLKVADNAESSSYDNVVISTNPKPVYLDDGEYHVIAVTNLSGDELSSLEKCKTLADVRDYIQEKAWTETTNNNVTSYSSFIMASANDNNKLTLESNSYNSPATVSVEVERLAARIDYKADAYYTISSEKDGDEAYEGSTVEILGGTVVNKLIAGTYLLKRVATPSESNDVTYLGEETANDDGVETNYVIDPWTYDKGKNTNVKDADGNPITIDKLYDEDTYYPGLTSKSANYWNKLISSGITKVDGWTILDYTLENTTFKDNTSKDFATGVVFQAQFNPKEGLVNNDYTHLTFDESGYTFFKWNNQLYATLEDILYANNEIDLIEEVSSCKDWEGLSSLINKYSIYEPTGYVQYLKDLYDEYEKDNTLLFYSTVLPWSYYASNYLGYSYSSDEGSITLDTFGKDKAVDYSSTQEALRERSDKAIETFKDSKCYYTWWIRHSNDGKDYENGVMEFAIVRNNIYKLKVAAITTLGGEVPTEGLQCNIYVVDWTMLDKETIKF